jgi:hypothetical protein
VKGTDTTGRQNTTGKGVAKKNPESRTEKIKPPVYVV